MSRREPDAGRLREENERRNSRLRESDEIANERKRTRTRSRVAKGC
jgi:hypothetical protein